MTFIKWYSRIALAIGLAFTVPYVFFFYETAVPTLNGMGLSPAGLGAVFTWLISGVLLAQALVVTLNFAVRARACSPLGSAPRREVRWHLAALALLAIGYFVPMTFRSIAESGSRPVSRDTPSIRFVEALDSGTHADVMRLGGLPRHQEYRAGSQGA